MEYTKKEISKIYNNCKKLKEHKKVTKIFAYLIDNQQQKKSIHLYAVAATTEISLKKREK